MAAVLAAAAAALLALGWTMARESRGIARGRTTYAKYCAACHGTTLQGQADWKQPLPTGRMPAPPHDATGHTWHHSDEQLVAIVKRGVSAIVPGYESDMPGFEAVLSDDEVRAVLAYIKSTWPERERQIQEASSRSEPPSRP